MKLVHGSRVLSFIPVGFLGKDGGLSLWAVLPNTARKNLSRVGYLFALEYDFFGLAAAAWLELIVGHFIYDVSTHKAEK